MRTIKLLERYCPKCKRYIDMPTYKKDTSPNREERCIYCNGLLTYAQAIYVRNDLIFPSMKKLR